MAIITVPRKLRIVLGDEGTEGLIEMLNQQQVQTKDAVIETAADRFERRLTEEAARLDNRITEADAGLRVEIAETRTGLSTKIEKSKTETIRWMFIFYIGQIAALAGILFAVLR